MGKCMSRLITKELKLSAKITSFPSQAKFLNFKTVEAMTEGGGDQGGPWSPPPPPPPNKEKKKSKKKKKCIV
jgi:hypothetical protein